MDKGAFQQFLQRAKRGQLLHMRTLSLGHDTEVYLLQTIKEKYICTVYLENRPLSFFSHLQQVTHYIAQQGLPTSRFLYCDLLEERQAILWSYIPGRVKTTWMPSEFYQAGLSVGSLHKLCEDFVPSGGVVPMITENQLKWNELRSHIPAPFHFIEGELEDIHQQWPCHLPYGLIHGDLWYTQFRFGKERVEGLIDFSLARKDLFIYDISALIKGIFYTPNTENAQENYQAFLTGYESIRQLSAGELEAIPLMIQCRIIHTILCLLHAHARTECQKKAEEYLNLATLNVIKYQEAISRSVLLLDTL